MTHTLRRPNIHERRGKEMRDILPFHFNRLEGEVIFVDPKNELKRLRQAVVRNDRKNPRAIYFGDHKQANINLMGKPGQGKTVYPIEDETQDYNEIELEGFFMGKPCCKYPLIDQALSIDPNSERIGNVAIEKWRDLRAGRLIVDECHSIYDPEADRFAEKLRNRGTKRPSSSDQT